MFIAIILCVFNKLCFILFLYACIMQQATPYENLNFFIDQFRLSQQ